MSDFIKMDFPPELYVSGLSYGCKPDELRRYYDYYGEVLRVKFLDDRNGKFKGAAIVTFRNGDDSYEAMRGTDGRKFQDRIIYARKNDRCMRGADRYNDDRRPPYDRRDHDRRDYSRRTPPDRRDYDRRSPERSPPRRRYSNDRSPRDRSPRDRSPRDWSPRDSAYDRKPYSRQMDDRSMSQRNSSYSKYNYRRRPEQKERAIKEINYYKDVMETFQEEISKSLKNEKTENPIEIDELGIPHIFKY